MRIDEVAELPDLAVRWDAAGAGEDVAVEISTFAPNAHVVGGGGIGGDFGGREGCARDGEVP